MKQKNKILLIIIIVLLAINGYNYLLPAFSKTEKDLQNINFDIAINSDELIASFIKDEKQSNNFYAEKIIEITGFVKEVTFLNNRNTVILYGKQKDFGIICDTHPSQINKIKSLKEHQKIKVKGICKGFLKDVILLNCYIETNLDE